LRSRRQLLHGRIVRALEQRFPEIAEAEPELLAHHCSAAGEAERAVDYWSKAGRRALERSAYAETITHTNIGLELLKPLAAGSERYQHELELQHSRAQALLASRGWTAPETGEAFTRARELCRALGHPPLTFPVLRGLCTFHWIRAEYNTALAIGYECLNLAEQQNDDSAVILAHRLIGQVLSFQGELGVGRQHLERSISLYDPQRHGASASIYGADSRLSALVYLSQLLWLTGFPDYARRVADEALSDAGRLKGKYDLIHALYQDLVTSLLRRDYDVVLQGVKRVLALAREHGVDTYVQTTEHLSDWALLAYRKQSKNISTFTDSTYTRRASGNRFRIPIHLGCLAEALATNGRIEEALVTITEALEVTERTGEHWSEAELHRLKGEILRVQDKLDATGEAETCFHRSLDIARRQSAKSWELRTATSFACLWRDQNNRQEAQNLLTPVYNWFSEGFDTQDLQDAKMLLEELSTHE
jgi:predicted ATPase